jgi:hypothetical protein
MEAFLMLGQMTVPAGFAAWIACAAFAVMLINQAYRLKGFISGGEKRTIQQPLEVVEGTQLVTREHCDLMHRPVSDRMAELEKKVQALDVSRQEDMRIAGGSRKAMYDRMEGLQKEMGDMERRLNRADEERTADLHTRLNEILEKVSELRGQVER